MAGRIHQFAPRARPSRLGCPKCKQPLITPFCPRDGVPAVSYDRLDLSDLLQGTVLGQRYWLLYRLGRGAMADVYAAWDAAARREVAVKVAQVGHRADDAVFARFRREARAIARLNHPNVVRIEAAARTPDGLVYLVLERLIGHTLAEFIDNEAPVEPRRAAALLAPLCDALAAVARAGFVHRDLKPANVFLAVRAAGEVCVKLLDFGIVRHTGEDPVEDRLSDGKVYGSAGYMAPETILRQRIDHRADLYAVGVLLHELVTGELPFDSEDLTEILRAHLNEPPPPLPPGCPAEMQQLHDELLAKSPAFRPTDGQEVAERLRALAAGVDVRLDPPALQTGVQLVEQGVERTDSPSGEAPSSTSSTSPATPGLRSGARRLPRPAPRSRRWLVWCGVGLAVAAAAGALLHVLSGFIH